MSKRDGRWIEVKRTQHGIVRLPDRHDHVAVELLAIYAAPCPTRVRKEDGATTAETLTGNNKCFTHLHARVQEHMDTYTHVYRFNNSVIMFKVKQKTDAFSFVLRFLIFCINFFYYSGNCTFSSQFSCVFMLLLYFVIFYS